MRLALYSDQEVPANAAMDARVMELIGVARPGIGYVSAAPEPGRGYFEFKRGYYAKLGAELNYLLDWETPDLTNALRELTACDAIHLSGGNTFEFLRWLKQRDVLPVLCAFAERGGVLIGVSAGAILMTPDVSSAALCGDAPDSLLEATAALGLVDFHFWPHYQTGAEHHLHHAGLLGGMDQVIACPDGAGVVIDGQRCENFGGVICMQNGACP